MALRADFARGTLERDILGHKPGEAEQQGKCDDGLRYGAIEAPDAEAVLLNHGKAEREEKSQGRHEECQETLACEAETAEQQVPGDAEDGDRYVGDHREAAVIHGAAIPVRVDVAGLGGGGVVKGQCQRRNKDAGERETNKKIAHSRWADRRFDPGYDFRR